MVNDRPGEADRPAPARRLVLLGASNIQRTFATLVANAELTLGGPLEVLSAMGHGRSYGRRSAVLARALPGILECGLWDALAAPSAVPSSAIQSSAASSNAGARETLALVTDIGNDLGFGYDTATILGWVEECLARLARREARVIVTALPLMNVERISPARYHFFRRLFFPGNRLSLEEMRARALELDAGLRALARQGGHALVEPRLEWYGLDPIHIRYRAAPRAWAEILSPWRAEAEEEFARAPALRRWRYRLLRAESRWMFGRAQRCEQPARRERDGATIALY